MAQTLKPDQPPCLVYVNAATYRGAAVAKVGFSVNPKKRLREFNNGLRHLRRKGYISEDVSFERFFSVPAASQRRARRLERAFLDLCKGEIVRELGLEVVGLNPEAAAQMLCRLAVDEAQT